MERAFSVRFLLDSLFVVSRGRLFFRTGLFRSWRTSNAPNRIEPTGFAYKEQCRWPCVPLLAPLSTINFSSSVRRNTERSRYQ